MEQNRRNVLATGAAATAVAAASTVFAQQPGQGGAAFSFYEKGNVRRHRRCGGLFRPGGANGQIRIGDRARARQGRWMRPTPEPGKPGCESWPDPGRQSWDALRTTSWG
jgi:hypothetical protein